MQARLIVVAVVTLTASQFPIARIAGQDTSLQGTYSHVCVEKFLGSDTAHGGTDYGAAINAAVQAQPLKEPSSIEVCASGEHKVYTPIVFDRPIAFRMTGAKLVPQSTLASTPVSIGGARLTAGSPIVSLSSTESLHVGMAIGGTGVTSSTYISAVGPGAITLSLPASIVANGVVTAGSPTVRGLNSMAGLVVGQTLGGFGIPAGTTIAALDFANQSLSLSGPADAGSDIPASFTVGGSWTADLKAVVTTPVISWVFNPSALHNSEEQMIGGSMYGVWIAPDDFRGLTGIQGVQIYGWDRMKSYDLQVENLAGSALILGGHVAPSTTYHGTVRESYFYDSELRDSGEWSTGQPVLELMTGAVPGHTPDEINQIGFVGGQLTFYYGEAITIGSFNSSGGPVNGPRLLWFTNNFQIEGGSHLTGPPIPAPVDAVHVIKAADIYFDGDEIAAPGFGKSLFRVDSANILSIQNSLLYDRGKQRTFTISTNPGSSSVSFVNGPAGVNSFDDTGLWNGAGAEISDGGACSPCTVHLKSVQAVDPSGKTLNLMSPFSGRSARDAKFTIGLGGYFINDTGTTLSKITALGNQYVGLDSHEGKLLGLRSPDLAWIVGSGFLAGHISNNVNDFDGLNASALGALIGDANVSLGGPSQVGSGATADCAAGHTCDSFSGEISLVTGSGQMTPGTIATVTFPLARHSLPNCSVSLTGGSTYVGLDKAESSSSLILRTLAGLNPRSTYTLTYSCGGK